MKTLDTYLMSWSQSYQHKSYYGGGSVGSKKRAFPCLAHILTALHSRQGQLGLHCEILSDEVTK